MTSWSVETPWKPATRTILSSSSALRMRCGLDVEDLGLGVHRVGDDAGLGAGQRDGVVAQLVDGHRHQSRRDALAGGEEHVHLAGGRVLGDLLGHLDELVGRVASGGHDGDDGVPLLCGRRRCGWRPVSCRWHPPPSVPPNFITTMLVRSALRSGPPMTTYCEPSASSVAGGLVLHGLLFVRHLDQCSASNGFTGR